MGTTTLYARAKPSCCRWVKFHKSRKVEDNQYRSCVSSLQNYLPSDPDITAFQTQATPRKVTRQCSKYSYRPITRSSKTHEEKQFAARFQPFHRLLLDTTEGKRQSAERTQSKRIRGVLAISSTTNDYQMPVGQLTLEAMWSTKRKQSRYSCRDRQLSTHGVDINTVAPRYAEYGGFHRQSVSGEYAQVFWILVAKGSLLSCWIVSSHDFVIRGISEELSIFMRKERRRNILLVGCMGRIANDDRDSTALYDCL